MKDLDTTARSGPPKWLGPLLDLAPLDVRSALAAGEDPLQTIMDAAAVVAEGGGLVVDAPFNPSPLRRVLAGAGFSSYGRRLADGHWRIFFHRDGGADWQREAEAEVGPEGAMSWSEEDGVHIDVRRLIPPQPMLAILRLLDGVDAGRPVVVHHDRVPQFLFPELAERGWRVVRQAVEFANVRLWLERVG